MILMGFFFLEFVRSSRQILHLLIKIKTITISVCNNWLQEVEKFDRRW